MLSEYSWDWQHLLMKCQTFPSAHITAQLSPQCLLCNHQSVHEDRGRTNSSSGVTQMESLGENSVNLISTPAILIFKTTWKGHHHRLWMIFFLAEELWWPGSELELPSSEKRTFGHTSHHHSNQDKWNLQKCYPKSMDEIQEKRWQLAGSQTEGAKKGKESKDSHCSCCSAFLLLAWGCSLVTSSVQ